MIRVQLAGRDPGLLDEISARLASPSIVIVGRASSIHDAMDADADVVVSLDGAPADAPEGEDDGPAVLVLAGDRELAPVAWTATPGWGLLPLSADADVLRAAVTAVAGGLVVLSREAFRRLARPRPRADDDEGLQEPLTPREREVLELASRGFSTRGAARVLGISEHTVKFHLASIYGKLGTGSRADAVRLGFRRGLISL